MVQFTPPGSEASIHIGTGITSAAGGSLQNVYLIVSDIESVRAHLISGGVDVSEVFHYDGLLGPKVSGPDPKRGSYGSFASFQDPDGNSWLLQEITTRLPGREWNQTRGNPSDVGNLAKLLQETEEHHGNYEKTHAKHNWWDWYAAYLSALQTGSSPEDATVLADRYMDDVHHIPLR